MLNTISDNFSKDTIKQLEKKFINLRNYSYQRVMFNRKYIEKIEKKEKSIIKRINSENKKCEIMLKTAENGFDFKSFCLPKVKFHNIIKKKKSYYIDIDTSYEDESENI